MTPPFADNLLAMSLARDGAFAVEYKDGRTIKANLGRAPFAETSAIQATTVHLASSQLHLRTVKNDDIYLELPSSNEVAPLQGRLTIYLDQNHWSTLTLAIHDPDRVKNSDERAAASHIIALASAGEIVLPMSAAHMSETCKQTDPGARYRRALTMAQLSRGWQLRDPLHVRHTELRQALARRYGQPDPQQPLAVTLEPDALHSGRDTDLPPVSDDFPEDARWMLHVTRCAAGNLDAMLDDEPIPMPANPAWTAQFQQFADFLRDNPTGKEMKRRRTWAKFVADLGMELPRAAHSAGITPEEMSDWTRNHSERDVQEMPTLGVYREILHEKLSDTQLRWEDNDLIDMMYLTTAAGYCDLVTAERAHASHIRNSLRRLCRNTLVHKNLRSLAATLQSR